jgi:hypothetical protein
MLPPPRLLCGQAVALSTPMKVLELLMGSLRLPARLRGAVAPGGRKPWGGAAAWRPGPASPERPCAPYPRKRDPFAAGPFAGARSLPGPTVWNALALSGLRPQPSARREPGNSSRDRVRGASPASWGPSSALQRAHPSSGRRGELLLLSPRFRGGVARTRRGGLMRRSGLRSRISMRSRPTSGAIPMS